MSGFWVVVGIVAFSNLLNAINLMANRTRLNQLEERVQQLESALSEKEGAEQ